MLHDTIQPTEHYVKSAAVEPHKPSIAAKKDKTTCTIKQNGIILVFGMVFS